MHSQSNDLFSGSESNTFQNTEYITNNNILQKNIIWFIRYLYMLEVMDSNKTHTTVTLYRHKLKLKLKLNVNTWLDKKKLNPTWLTHE